MNINLLREFDVFGTEIKWRFLSKDNFKSLFGSMITMILAALLGVKIFFFINKTNEYGFARYKINQQFNDFQFVNMSDMRMVIISDLDFIIDSYTSNNNKTFYPNGYFNLSDFIEISFYDNFSNDFEKTPKMIETDCIKNSKFKAIQEIKTREEQALYKCLAFKEDQNTLEITKNDTNILNASGNPLGFKLDSVPMSALEFKMKNNLVDILKSNNQNFNLYMFLSNSKPNTKNYEIEEYSYYMYIPFDLNFSAIAEITLNKLSVIKKFDFDIFEIEFSNENKIHFSEDSFKLLKNARSNYNNGSNENIEYIDYFFFRYKFFEDIYEVTFLSLDDILAVLGGFMQIVFTIGQVFAMLYNERNGERTIWNHCMENYYNYDRTINKVRNNIQMQMDYYNEFLNKNKITGEIKFDKLNRDEILDRKYHTNNNKDASRIQKKEEVFNIKKDKIMEGLCKNDFKQKINSNQVMKESINDIKKEQIENIINENINESKSKAFDSDKENMEESLKIFINKNNDEKKMIENESANKKEFSNLEKNSFHDSLTLINQNSSALNLNFLNSNEIAKKTNDKLDSSDNISKSFKEFSDEDVIQEYDLNEKKISDKFNTNKKNYIRFIEINNNSNNNDNSKNDLIKGGIVNDGENNNLSSNKNFFEDSNDEKKICSKNIKQNSINKGENKIDMSESNIDHYHRDDGISKICLTEKLDQNELKMDYFNDVKPKAEFDNKDNFMIKSCEIKSQQNIEMKRIFYKIDNIQHEKFGYNKTESNNQVDFLLKDSNRSEFNLKDERRQQYLIKNNRDSTSDLIDKKKTDNKRNKNKRHAIFISTKKSKFLEKTQDFLELVSIDRYLKLLSGFEAFKFFYFNELNKFNFENYSDLFIFSQNYKFDYLEENTFTLNEKSLPMDQYQMNIFQKFLDNLNKY